MPFTKPAKKKNKLLIKTAVNGNHIACGHGLHTPAFAGSAVTWAPAPLSWQWEDSSKTPAGNLLWTCGGHWPLSKMPSSWSWAQQCKWQKIQRHDNNDKSHKLNLFWSIFSSSQFWHQERSLIKGSYWSRHFSSEWGSSFHTGLSLLCYGWGPWSVFFPQICVLFSWL